MIKKWLILFFVLSSFFVGCSSYISRYYFESDNSDQNPNQVFKETTFGRYNHSYEDNSIKLYMGLGPTAFGFQLENKLETPLCIIWDSAKVLLDYERIYQISNRMENISNEYVEINWLNKKDTIFCSILNKTKTKMVYSADSGFVAIGKSFQYNFSDVGLKNYKDRFIEINWQFLRNKIVFSLINISKLNYTISKDEGKIFINSQKEYYLSHIDREQELLKLPDSSDLSFSKISLLLQLQKADSLFKIKPTILLPKSTLTDELIPLTNYILPYTNNNYFDLDFSTRGFKDCKLLLIFPIKINDKVFKYSFPFKIKDYQILMKG